MSGDVIILPAPAEVKPERPASETISRPTEMPDLSVSRHEVLARQLNKPVPVNGLVPIKSRDFRQENHRLTVANSLFQAVIRGSVNKVKHLLARGTSIVAKNDYGLSVLVAALHIEDDVRRRRMFKLLLERGAAYKARDARHDRPVLHWAAVLGQHEQVKTLLVETAGDIDLSETDGEGYTALHHAVRAGSMEIADTLVDFHVRFGISVDSVDRLGLTPYMHSRRLGYRDIATVLKEKGLASVGHGDMMFRLPKEWSSIGKFERKKAIHLQTDESNNAARILGRPQMVSPRMAVPGIVLPAYRPTPEERGMRRRPQLLSVSLPALNEAANESDDRPHSVNGEAKPDEDNDKPGPPTVAFAEKSQGGALLSGSKTSSDTGSIPPLQTSRNRDVFQSKSILRPINAVNGGAKLLPISSFHSPYSSVPVEVPTGLPGALSILGGHEAHGKLAGTKFHASQPDTSKMDEFKNTGNLCFFMDVLSQQQSKSFRKSVLIEKPKTPPQAKKKSKVSSLAIIFGGKRGKSPKKRKSAGGSASKRSGKGARGASGKSGKGVTGGKTGKSNKMPVPAIKINAP